MWPPELDSVLCGSRGHPGSSEVRERVTAVELTVATSADWRESRSVPVTAGHPHCYTDIPTGHSGESPFPQLRDRRHGGEVGAPGAGAVEAMVDSGAASLPVRLYRSRIPTKPGLQQLWTGASLYTSDFPARRGHHPHLACGPQPPSKENWLTCSVLMLNPAPCPHSATSLPPAADMRDPQGY